MTPAERDVLAERRRQVEEEGWTAEHDDQHMPGNLARAGSAYTNMAGLRCATEDGANVDTSKHALPYLSWPFEPTWWKPKTIRRDLVRGCALIIAEIERLDRLAVSDQPRTPEDEG